MPPRRADEVTPTAVLAGSLTVLLMINASGPMLPIRSSPDPLQSQAILRTSIALPQKGYGSRPVR
jgi:hypothetical protein